MLTRGKKTKQVKDGVTTLAECINFTPAKSKEEAINFAKTNLGVKNYSDDMPLDVMNWVNEGLVNYSNVHKGKNKLFDTIFYDLEKKGNSIASVITEMNEPSIGMVLTITKNTLDEKIPKIIRTCIDNMLKRNWISIDSASGKFTICRNFENGEISDNLLKLVEKFNKDSKTCTFSERMELYESLRVMINAEKAFMKAPVHSLKKMLADEKVSKILQEKNLLPNMDEFAKLPTKEQNKMLSK